MGVERSFKDYVCKFFKHVTLIIASFVCLLPLVSCVFAAFKTKEEFGLTSKVAPPQNWGYLDNFINFWNDSGFLQISYFMGICKPQQPFFLFPDDLSF